MKLMYKDKTRQAYAHSIGCISNAKEIKANVVWITGNMIVVFLFIYMYIHTLKDIYFLVVIQLYLEC